MKRLLIMTMIGTLIQLCFVVAVYAKDPSGPLGAPGFPGVYTNEDLWMSEQPNSWTAPVFNSGWFGQDSNSNSDRNTDDDDYDITDPLNQNGSRDPCVTDPSSCDGIDDANDYGEDGSSDGNSNTGGMGYDCNGDGDISAAEMRVIDEYGCGDFTGGHGSHY